MALTKQVTSDCDADSDVFNSHHYTPTASQAVADILRAGVRGQRPNHPPSTQCRSRPNRTLTPSQPHPNTLTRPTLTVSFNANHPAHQKPTPQKHKPEPKPYHPNQTGGGFMTNHAPQALKDGNITVADIDVVLKRLFRVRLRLGHFDPPGVLEMIGYDQVCTDYAVELARDGVRQSAVLVKNSGNLLPLNAASYSKPVVIGPNMDYTGVTGVSFDAHPAHPKNHDPPNNLNPNPTTLYTLTKQYYGGQPCVLPSGQYFTPLDAIKQHIPSATGVRGVPSVGSNDRSGIPAAAAAAAAADLVFLSIGSNLDLESEGNDRTSIAFSDGQQALIAAVLAAVKPGTPVVALVQSGGAMDFSPVLSVAGIGAALHLGQPSVQVLGAGDVVFGKTLDGRPVAPAGRMNQQSYPASYTSAVSMFDFGSFIAPKLPAKRATPSTQKASPNPPTPFPN